MTESAAHRVDAATAKKVAHHIGYYVLAVAKHLLAEGVPVTSLLYEAPQTTDTTDNRPERFYEADGDIFFAHELRRKLVPSGDAWLDWSETSGWSLTREEHESRWLGAGLVIEPERVAGFLLAAQVDPGSVGSAERPFYRRAGHDYDQLLERLAIYLPERKAGFGIADPEALLTLARKSEYERRFVREILTGQDDPVVELPVRRSELRALGHLLEFLEIEFPSIDDPGPCVSLSQDLNSRVGGGLASADTMRTVLDEARTLKAAIDKRPTD